MINNFAYYGYDAANTQTRQRLATRIMQVDQNFRAELLELVEAGDVPVEFPNVLNLITLLPSGSNANSNPHSNVNTSNDIFYYSTNHLGSTAFVTDGNATVTQGFLYAPFGEITTEYTPLWQNGIMPKYTFNAKELDEETGMYYYEARYYQPPVFVSRNPMMDQKPWLTPYHYCSNNPVGRVDPTGMTDEELYDKWRYNTESGELTWLSDEGGSTNQTVEMVHNGEDGKLYYNKTKAVNFDGAIDRMFDFSVCTPGVDKAVSGMMDVVNGAMTFLSGAAIGAGTTALSSGVLAPLAEPLGAAFCFLGGGQMGNGFKQIAEGIDGAKSSPYTPREVLKDIGYTGVGYSSEKVSRFTVFQNIKVNSAVNAANFGASVAWTLLRMYKTIHPEYKGIPQGATITRK